MKKNAILFLLTLLGYIGYAQVSIEWQKQIGGAGEEWTGGMVATPDGGFVVIGESASTDGDAIGLHGFKDIWVVKLDSVGSLAWQRMYGGSAGEFSASIQTTSDGGYILSGLTYSEDGDVSIRTGIGDCWVVKIDASGNIEWERTYSSGPVTEAANIVQTQDGGYLVAATSSGASYWLIKINPQGQIIWQKYYGGSGPERLNKIRQTSDKGFILVGGSYSNNVDVTGHHGSTLFSDYWVVKTDSTGVLEWQKSLGGSFLDEAFNVLVTSDGSYLVGGISQSNDGDVSDHHGTPAESSDSWMVKLDPQGNILWSRSMGGTSSNDRSFSTILESPQGNYILAGVSDSQDGDLTGLNKGLWDAWIVELSETGSINWQRTIGGSGNDYIVALAPTADGGYVTAGASGSTDGDVTVPVHPSGLAIQYDFWMAKSSIILKAEDLPTKNLQLYPNPFFSSFSIDNGSETPITQISIYNAVGQKIHQVEGFEGRPINGSFLPNGWYYLHGLTRDGKILQAKLLKQGANP